MKLKASQWIAISATLIVVLVIYLFADTSKPAAPKPAGPMASRDKEGQKEETAGYDWTSYLQQVKSKITNQDTLMLIKNWEKGETEIGLRSLANFYQSRGETVVEAHYALALGQLRRDSMMLHAGNLFMATASITTDEALQHYLLDQAVESYKDAVQVDSAIPNRLKLASAYITQGTSPMQGVGILLDIVTKDPNNVDAQLLLGQFGIVSRQYDKAIVRLEKVVSLQPQNDKAIYLLAIAYGSKGDKRKALELLDRCAKLDANQPKLLQNIEETRKGLLNGQ